MDDREIIKRVKNGEAELFRLIVERYYRPLLKFIHSLTGDPFLTEDIGQSVFLAFYKSLESYNENKEAPVSAWLFITARNQALNILKKEARLRPTDRIDDYEATTGSSDPDDLLIRKEEREHLETCLSRVPEPYRTTLRQSLRGASIEEIARAEDVRPGTIKSRLNRARKKCIAIYKALLNEVRYD